MNKSLQQNLPWTFYGESTTFIETKHLTYMDFMFVATKGIPFPETNSKSTWKMDGWKTGFVLGPGFLANAIC